MVELGWSSMQVHLALKVQFPSEKQRQNTQKCDQIPKIFSSTIQSKVPPQCTCPLGHALSACPGCVSASFQLLIASYN